MRYQAAANGAIAAYVTRSRPVSSSPVGLLFGGLCEIVEGATALPLKGSGVLIAGLWFVWNPADKLSCSGALEYCIGSGARAQAGLNP